ncbi:MAG: pilus assembly PilX N-terminal domain-containing protein [Halioglobus sp.]|nr:pilus assembly PilX N-terminal domain-containing protein [Halioglobus sp.]
MSGFAGRSQQQGMALVVSLLFLLILTVISVVAATNSRSALKMSMNAQDGLQSFQAAEAGVYAALATSGTANDLFMGASTEDVFAAYGDDDNPLRLLDSGPDSVTTDVFLTVDATACPRRANGSSVGLFDCDYYRIESEHEVERRARTRINVGVVKTIIGKNVR